MSTKELKQQTKEERMSDVKCKLQSDGAKTCWETRSYQGQELRCEVRPSAWWSGREDMCVLPEQQIVGGVELPWATTVYIKKSENGKKWISYARVQSLFGMGETIRFKGMSIPHALGVFFNEDGIVSSISLFHDGCTLLLKGQKYPWDACCRLHNGCSIMFTNDGSFNRCETFEMPGSD